VVEAGDGFLGIRAHHRESRQCREGQPGAVIKADAEDDREALTTLDRMSSRQRPASPPSSNQNRSNRHRDRADRDPRRERDGERYDRERRDRDEYRSSGSGRRDRDYDSKRGSRRSASPPPRSSRRPRDSRSKSPSSRRRRSRSRSRSKSRRMDGGEDKGEDEEKGKNEEKGKPNFGNSGLLAAATKTVKTGEGKNVVLKYHEPPEARKPLLGWRLYVFKGKEQVGG